MICANAWRLPYPVGIRMTMWARGYLSQGRVWA